MAKFVFRLQTVLDHKKRLEELAQVEHARAQAAQVREEGALQSLTDAESNGFAELERQRHTGRLDIESLQLGMAYLDALKVQIQRQEQVVHRVRRATAARRDQLVAAVQERKTLERLREKQHQEFLAEEARREATALDDLVIMRHTRQMIETRRTAALAAATASRAAQPTPEFPHA
jgi:flagellar protein FliJ